MVLDNALIEFPFLDQCISQVIVGLAEIGVEFDCSEIMTDCFVKLSQAE